MREKEREEESKRDKKKKRKETAKIGPTPHGSCWKEGFEALSLLQTGADAPLMQRSMRTAFHLCVQRPQPHRRGSAMSGLTTPCKVPGRVPSAHHFPKPIFNGEMGRKRREKGEQRDLQEAPLDTLTPLHPVSGGSHLQPMGSMHNRRVLSEVLNAKS